MVDNSKIVESMQKFGITGVSVEQMRAAMEHYATMAVEDDFIDESVLIKVGAEAERTKYPGVTLEEAEAVASLLGWDHEIREVSYIAIGAEMSASQVDDYVFNLLGALFGEFEDGYNGKTWEDCPPMARDFYQRASVVEVM